MNVRLRLAAVLILITASLAAAGQSLVDGKVIFGNSFKPVPNMTVHLVNKDRKPPLDLTGQTSTDGRYSFDDVPPGTGYAVAVYDTTGRLVGTDASFEVLADARHTAIPDIDISKGVLADRAERSGGLIQNDKDVSPGANITNQQLRVLPLYDRTFLALGAIQPGVHDVPQGSPLVGAGFSIAGSPENSTNFLLDGVDNVAASNSQAIPFQVNEAVQEFRVVYAAPDMRYGQGIGGIINVVTSRGNAASGGKAWHGSLFGYFNNDALNSGSPLSAYSTSTFARAAATASDGAGDAIAVGVNEIDDDSFNGYAPQRYNQLFKLTAPGSPIGGPATQGCTTQLCQAGAFNPASILSSQDSHTYPISSQQFGGSIGGPLFNNKLFFFVSYEGTQINNPTPIFERVPTALDAPGVANVDGAIAKGLLGVLPAPNVGQTGAGLMAGTNAGVLGFYRGYAPNYTHVHNVHVRPEISLGTYGTISLRYTGQLIDQLHDDTLPAGGAYPGNGADRRAQNQSASLTHSLPFGQSINTLNVGFTQFRVDEVAQDRNFNAQALGLPGGAMSTVVVSGLDTRTTGAAPGSPGLMGGWFDSFWNACPNGTTVCGTGSVHSPSPITPSLDGQFPMARIGAPLSAPSAHRDTEAFLSDVLELHLGSRNTLTLGGDYRYQQNYSYSGGLARGLVVSNNIGEFTSDSETCISCGASVAFQHPSFDYELRQPSGYVGDLRSSSFGIFGEHKIQPIPRLTISLGARYEFFGEPLDAQNRLWNFDAGDQGLVRQGSTGTFDAFNYQCGVGSTTSLDALYGARRVTFNGGWNCAQNGKFFLPNDKNNVLGHFGVSYSPDEKYHDVFRAAGGVYYDHLPSLYNETLLHNRPSPYNVTNPSAIYGQNFYSTACGDTESQCAFGLHTLSFSALPAADAATFQSFQAASGANILYERDVHQLRTPYSFQFTTSYQHQFGNSWAGEIVYAGSFNRKLPLIYDSNFANEFYCTQGGGTSSTPGGLCNNNTFFPVFTESNIGSSSYHSLVVRVRSEQWHGLTVHAAYTFAKSNDDIAGGTFPQSTDALWSQIFGRQLYGMGNPISFALGSNSLSPPGALKRSHDLADSGSRLARDLFGVANIPSFSAISSALTTTGSRSIDVSHYSLPQNPLGFSQLGTGGDGGRSDFDVQHRGVVDFVYAPVFHNRWIDGFLISGIFTAQSGQPFSIFSGPAYGQITQRINLSQSTPIHMTGNPNGYISGAGRENLVALGLTGKGCPTLYAQPTLYSAVSSPAACIGTSGRNAFTGPAFISQDLALQRAFHLTERRQILLRAESYNVFNRANYYNPISEISEDGVHINPEFGLVRSAHDPRLLQFAARYEF
ncbi:MAG TPA: TonB-dependent receptor [Granulicella sp.]